MSKPCRDPYCEPDVIGGRCQRCKREAQGLPPIADEHLTMAVTAAQMGHEGGYESAITRIQSVARAVEHLALGLLEMRKEQADQ